MNVQTSKQLFEEAVNLMPGGVNSPVRAFGSVGRTPLFIDHGTKGHIVDVDGNEFVDYVCSWGPGILGHAREEVIDAVQKACQKGLTFGAPTQLESELSKMVIEAMPSIEMLRMVNSGTEAVMSAIRAARGYTKRDKIVKFKGCYHGHSDGLLVKAGSAALTSSVPDSAGVPASYTEQTLVALYNDRQSVIDLFENNPNDIAALIVEPVAANMGVVPPEEGFLQFLRDITKQYGTVLIFDEVITGFRLAYGGAQQYYGIDPDMTTLGKIVGGGMPMAVYGGKRDIMECVSPVGKVYQAGTLSGNPIAVTAGIETLKLLKSMPYVYEDIDQKAKQIADAFRQKAKQDNIDLTVNQVGSLMCAYFTKEQVTNYDQATSSDTGKYADYFGHMLEHGIYVAPSQFEAMFISYAHTKEDIDATCKAILSL